MQSRVAFFSCTGALQNLWPGGVPQCKHCLARWIKAGAEQGDASEVLAGSRLPVSESSSAVGGLTALLAAIRCDAAVATCLREELTNLGALHVNELQESDWHQLASWGALRPLERRRLMGHLAADKPFQAWERRSAA